MTGYVKLNFPDADEDTQPDSWTDWTVWATGFRPFFLAAALMAAVAMVGWTAVFFGGLNVGGPAGPVGWHAHEMVFGFTPAVIAGFLLTAVPKWTGGSTPTGGVLAGLVGLWVAGRVAMAAAGWLPYGVVAAVDLAFLPALAVAISLPIGRSKTVRNFGFIPLLFGLAGANALFHLDHLSVIDGWASRGLDAGLGIIMVIIAVVGGRVIPFFAASALGGESPDRRRVVDIAALVLSVGWLIALVVEPLSVWTAALALGAGAANLVRMVGWRVVESLSVPLLWVLQAGYLFVGVGLLLYAASVLDVGTVSRSAAIHALTTGAIGILCLGMMARVSLGHTGRQLKAHPLVVAAFALAVAAAVVRIGAAVVLPGDFVVSVGLAAGLWTAAWVAFLVVYVPILVRPRADGRPG